MIYSCGFLKKLDVGYVWITVWFSRGECGLPDAEGAKVTQRTQKRGEKKVKKRNLEDL
jgi:hypothetical protein